MKKNNLWLVLMIVVGLCLACGSDNQTSSSDEQQVEEANKLSTEEHAIETQMNELDAKSSILFPELMGDNLAKTKTTEIEAYKVKNKSKFDEWISLKEQSAKLGIEAANKVEQASKLKVPKIFKEYLDLKVEERKKYNEVNALAVPFIKTFLQTKEVDKIKQQFAEFQKAFDNGQKVYTEAKNKLEQFKKENM